MRIVDIKELWGIYRENPAKAIEILKEVDYVLDDWGYFIDAKYFLARITGSEEVGR